LHLRLFGGDQGIQVLHHEASCAEEIFNPLQFKKKNRTGSHGGVILQLKMVEKTEYLQCSFLNFHPHVSKELLPQKI